MQFITFHVGKCLFGIPILLIRELTRHMQVTPVPLGPESLEGLINLRGEVITVFNLGRRLGMESQAVTEATRCIIMKTDQDTAEARHQGKVTVHLGMDPVGFVVDQVSDVYEIDEDQIQPVPANLDDIGKEFVSGVAPRDRELLLILAVDKVLDRETDFMSERDGE